MTFQFLAVRQVKLFTENQTNRKGQKAEEDMVKILLKYVQ